MNFFSYLIIVLVVLLPYESKAVNLNNPNIAFEKIDSFIIHQIDAAETSVDVCVFIFEWQPIADAMIRAKERGCKVSFLTDQRSLNLEMLGG